MNDRFPIIDISTWPIADDEPMGTKPKFWVREPGGDEWLWKRKSRTHSDDDWTEKAAAELAELLGIPHAHVELAHIGNDRGIISRNIVKDWKAVELIYGNQLLWELDSNYPMKGFYRNAQHTLDRVFRALDERSIRVPFWKYSADEITTSSELFLGYLLFDAWIGNSDRHHENWGVLKYRDDSLTLAPSYDHASSLGHNIPDAERNKRLQTKDKGYRVEAFAAKSQSALYAGENDAKPMRNDVTFRTASTRYPRAGEYWLNRLQAIDFASATGNGACPRCRASVSITTGNRIRCGLVEGEPSATFGRERIGCDYVRPLQIPVRHMAKPENPRHVPRGAIKL